MIRGVRVLKTKSLTPKEYEIIINKDKDEKGFKSAIFYLNTNNGYTKIGNKKIQSIENRIEGLHDCSDLRLIPFSRFSDK